MSPDYEAAIEVYSRAREYVRGAGYEAEIDELRISNFATFGESDLLRESAWVILNSGFRESIVRRAFDHVSLSFCDWESAEAIVTSYPACKWSAAKAFGNERKLEAIVEIARSIQKQSFEKLKGDILISPVSELQKFPQIGAITSFHLAKNLGLDVAKPDRHLARVSRRLGFENTHAFCRALSSMVREEVKVVDLVIWRYLADNAARRAHWV